jgi:hypothetical protein
MDVIATPALAKIVDTAVVKTLGRYVPSVIHEARRKGAARRSVQDLSSREMSFPVGTSISWKRETLVRSLQLYVIPAQIEVFAMTFPSTSSGLLSSDR